MLHNKSYKQAAAYVWVALVPFLLLYLSVFDNRVMMWDMADYFFPYRYLIGEALQNGLLPAWNPYQNFGIPLYGDPQSGFWYPITWVIGYLHGYTLPTMYFEYTLHLAIAGTGMLFLLRRMGIGLGVAVIFSMLYSFNGFFISNAQHLSWVTQGAWLPWVLGCYYAAVYQRHNQYLLAAPVALYMMLAGGYPPFFVMFHYFLLSLFLVKLGQWLWQKDYHAVAQLIGRHLLIYGLFFIAAVGMFYSFATSYPLISYSDAFSLQKAAIGFFPPQGSLSLLWPFSVAAHGQFPSDISMLSIYLGVVGLIGFVASIPTNKSWFVWSLFLFSIISLLISWADFTPVHQWLYHVLPGINRFRQPATFRLFFILGALVCGAWWMHRQITLNRRDTFNKLLGAFAAVMLVMIAVFMLTRQPWTSFTFAGPLPETSIMQRIAFNAVVQLLVVTLVWLSWKHLHKTGRYYLMIAAVLLDIFLNLQLTEPVTIVADRSAKKHLQEMAVLPKGFTTPKNQPTNTYCLTNMELNPIWMNHNMLYKTPCHGGYNPFRLRMFSELDSVDRPQTVPIIRYRNTDGQLVGNGASFTRFDTEHINLHFDRAVTEVVLMQINYPGWYASVNGQQVLPEANLPVLVFNLKQPITNLQIVHRPIWLMPLVYLTGACLLLYSSLFVWMISRLGKHLT